MTKDKKETKEVFADWGNGFYTDEAETLEVVKALMESSNAKKH